MDLKQHINWLNSKKLGLLSLALSQFKELNLSPVIGIELEFYLTNNNQKLHSFAPEFDLVKQFMHKVDFQLKNQQIGAFNIAQEQGFGQLEIKTFAYQDITKLCIDIIKTKEIIVNLAQDLELNANFQSQPFLDDCGSALQINFSLIDQKQNYLFVKKDKQHHNQESPYLIACIDNLLKLSRSNMIIFAPESADYQRFNLANNYKLHQQRKFTAPVNLSWGYENRTVMVRVPYSETGSLRRLEFRLPAANCDVHLAMLVFLLMVLEAVKSVKNDFANCLQPKIANPIYGNAFDQQYSLEMLPDHQKAIEYFLADSWLVDQIKALEAMHK